MNSSAAFVSPTFLQTFSSLSLGRCSLPLLRRFRGWLIRLARLTKYKMTIRPTQHSLALASEKFLFDRTKKFVETLARP